MDNVDAGNSSPPDVIRWHRCRVPSSARNHAVLTIKPPLVKCGRRRPRDASIQGQAGPHRRSLVVRSRAGLRRKYREILADNLRGLSRSIRDQADNLRVLRRSIRGNSNEDRAGPGGVSPIARVAMVTGDLIRPVSI